MLAELFRPHGSELVHLGFISGLPGFVTREADGELQTTALDIEDSRVVAIYLMRNPEKLRHLREAVQHFVVACHALQCSWWASEIKADRPRSNPNRPVAGRLCETNLREFAPIAIGGG
jgi:hypothetical protein